MIKLWFQDIDWTDSNGNIIQMGNPNFMYLNSRLLHNYTPPTIIEETWNGQTFPVQINIWEGYQMQVAYREMSMQHIAKIQSCKKIWIEDTNTNEIIEVDTQTNGGINIEPLGRLGTANQGFMMSFKANRITTYPGLVRDNTHNLVITYNSTPYTFYTDYSIISFVSDAEQSQFDLESGIKYTAKTINKEGKRLLFFLMESDAIELKKYAELAEPADVALNTTINPVEVLKCKIDELSEGLYKCEIEMITSSNYNYV